jgi:hypothetical protein
MVLGAADIDDGDIGYRRRIANNAVKPALDP